MIAAVIGSILWLGAQDELPKPVKLTLVRMGTPRGGLPATVEIVATASEGSVERRFPVLLGRQPEDRALLDLTAGVWTVAIRGPAVWSPETTLRVGSDTLSEARIRVWPTATITTDLVADAKGPPLPRQMLVNFRGSPAVPAEQRVPNAVSPCRVEQRRASCEVPAALLDIRLVAPGLIPEYRWDASQRAGETLSIGTFRVQAGASVIGYIRDLSGGPAVGARVELRAAGGQRIPAAAATQQGAQRAASELEADQRRYPLLTTTNNRGFFQIRQAPAGEYRVVAMSDEDSAAETTVSVDSNAESALPATLVLEAPYGLEVSVEPPRHPDGGPWTLTLIRLLPFEAVTTQVVPESGATRLERVGRGRYILEVSAEGDRWFVQALEVDAPPGPVLIQIAAIFVEGRLRLGGKPLQATLHFGGTRPPLVTLESGEDGGFEGHLPQPGNWPVWVVAPATRVDRMLRSVKVAPDEFGRAKVEIDLEDIRLTGRVVDERGQGVRAFVRLNLADIGGNTSRNSLSTDSEGRFEASGLEPGSYTLSAQAERGKISEPITLHLADGGAEVTLHVRDLLEVRGRIFSAATGRPLAGARALAWPADQLMTGSPNIVTDAEGGFLLRVPAVTRGVEVLYWADGHSVRMSREQVVPGRDLVLAAEPGGGTLVIAVPAAKQGLDSESVIAVVHRGAAFWVGEFQRPTGGVARGEGDTSAIVIPNMAGGDYAVCEISRGLYRSKRQVLVDPNNCVKGSLAAGGELALTMSGSSPRPGGGR